LRRFFSLSLHTHKHTHTRARARVEQKIYLLLDISNAKLNSSELVNFSS